MLHLNNDAYYTGITNNLPKRLKTHEIGKGSKYVRGRLPFSVVYIQHTANRSEASKREAAIKKLTRAQKIELIKNFVRSKNMSFPIKPLYDQVFVKKEGEDVTKSGFHLPQSVKGRHVTGIVVAAGPGLLSPFTGGFLPMSVKVGDRVYLKEFSGYILKYPGQEDVHIFKEAEIVGVIPDSEEEGVDEAANV